MNRSCPRQEEIRQAFLEGPLEEELSGHALSCPDCGEQLMVASALGQLDSAALPEPTLPQSEYLWFKARMEQRLQERGRSQRIASRIYAASAVLLLAAVPLIIYWLLQGFGPGNVDEGMRQWSDSVANWASLGALTLCASLLTAILFGVLLRFLGRRLA